MSDTYLDPARKHDAILLFDVTDGNPNGDPDAGGIGGVDAKLAPAVTGLANWDRGADLARPELGRPELGERNAESFFLSVNNVPRQKFFGDFFQNVFGF